ncbi:hypothetical protein K435DRAFT_782363 [Dendrothele bispora CBS 962.96]|uniref:F-box domain-containing protein n=1 Tax=Dendrothele bispora (strain CBS 962.96) TaxID=1314807 RepID=A0A4S8LFB9_DENBC|nr:hypothetical protein K435DRAFT_782363 [Dendrothele bispora CBS 962.96]
MSESTAAINHLPDEILRKILELAIRGTFRIHPSPQLSAFSSVNHHWRSLCFNSSELWTDICIIYDELYGKVKLSDWTRQWLERSYPRLVDIYLDIPIEDFSPDAREGAIHEARNVISVLMEHLGRIRSLTTGDDSNAKDSGLLALIDSLPSATHLEHLDLRFSSRINPSFSISMDNVLHAGVVLPNLRSQRLKHINIVFPLERLSSVDIHLLSPNEDSFRQMACMCPTLERLTLRSLHPWGNPLLSGVPPILMPSLQFLSVDVTPLSGWGSSSQKSILSILSAPKLHHLRIDGRPGTPHPKNILPPLVSLPSLYTLRIDRFELFDPASHRVFKDMTYYQEPSSVKHFQLVQTSRGTIFPPPPPAYRVFRSNSSQGPQNLHWSWHDSKMTREITLPLLTPRRNERGTSTSTSTALPTGPILFPSLETLTLNSIRYQDVLWLCELIANHQPNVPSSSSSIKRVYLSKSSMKHLRTSFTLKIPNLKDKSNGNGNNSSSSSDGSGSGSSGRGRELEGLTPGGVVVDPETSPATVVVRVKDFRTQFPSRDSSETKEEEEEKEKEKEDDGFTLEGWLRDRVDVCELDMENEEEEEDL